MNALPLAVVVLIGCVSLVTLIASADFAVSRAVAVARQFDVSPLIIGTTLVAMSTSLAELAVNMAVTVSGGDNSIVVGNILGSNLVNIGLGLGIAALITPIHTATIVIEREILLYFAVTALLTAFALDKILVRSEGIILVISFGIVIFLIYQYAARGRQDVDVPLDTEDLGGAPSSHLTIPYTLLALIALVVSAEVLVETAGAVARALGVSSYLIGLTIVGIGTSLPEIATSVQAARRHQVDLVLGNVFGSNVFNICIALGLPAVIREVKMPAIGLKDLYFINLYGAFVIFLLLAEYELLGENKVLRRGGGLLVAALYLGYLIYKILDGR